MISCDFPFGSQSFIFWRLDKTEYKKTWDSAEGAVESGGRWNSVGQRAVYCSLDPATAILEVAAHKGFRVLDTVAHVLTAARVTDPGMVHVVDRSHISNPFWLTPGSPSAGQMEFGDALLRKHKFIAIPSAVLRYSWNLIFDPISAGAHYTLIGQEEFALDTRLHPPRRK